jgi:type VI secretion system protein ImpK
MTPPDKETFAFGGESEGNAANEDEGKSETPVASPHITLPPDIDIASRLVKIGAARNPLLEAAKPLLLAIAQTPKELAVTGSIDAWYELLEQGVGTFTQICNKTNIRREHVLTASYCLTTALDEAANSTSWGGSKAVGQMGAWAGRMQLAARFHDDIEGGKKFFLLIGRLSSNVEEHLDLLEVMYYIIGLGFEGQYSTITNGRRELEIIRHRLFTLLSAARGSVPRELSPHWRGETPKRTRFWRNIPVWVSGCVLGLAVFAQFSWYKYHLLQQSTVVQEKISAIGKLTPPPVRVLRLAELLKEEIAQEKVSVDEDDDHSAVTFRSDDMFVPGQAQVNPGILPMLERIAVEIGKVPGDVQVIGHSDNYPIRTSRFTDNYALSRARADNVARALEAQGVLSSRIETIGKADSEPVAENTTSAGRAKNRRVQIVVQQGPAPASTPVASPESAR